MFSYTSAAVNITNTHLIPVKISAGLQPSPARPSTMRWSFSRYESLNRHITNQIKSLWLRSVWIR